MSKIGKSDSGIITEEQIQEQSLVKLLNTLDASLDKVVEGDSQAIDNVRTAITETRLEAINLMRHQVELSTLYILGKELASILDLNELLNSILGKALSLVKAERGFLVLSKANGQDFEIALAHGMDNSEKGPGNDAPAISRQLIDRVLETREPLITVDAQHDQRFDLTASLVGYSIHSVLAVPLIYQQDLMGAIYLDTRIYLREFQAHDLELLTAMANQAAVALHIARLYEDLQQKNQELTAMLKELRETQEELIRVERLSAVGRMASTIIHDIKGPLTSIRGFANLLGRNDLSGEQRHRFSEMTVRAVDSFVGMTQEILDYAEGKQALEMEAFVLGGFLKEMEEFISAEFANDIEVRLQIEYAGTIIGDRQRLWRAIYNIAKNAAEAMSQNNRKKSESILTIISRRSGVWLELILSDTGMGIPPEIRDQLFQPFVTYGKTHGTGLGLSIVQGIVEAHNGQISVQSEVGRGATFTIRLPLDS